MKIEIETKPEGVKVTFAMTASAKPVSQTLSREEIQGLAKLLEVATKAEAFRFTFESSAR